MTAIPSSTGKEHEIAIRSQEVNVQHNDGDPSLPGSGAPLDPAVAERHSPQGQSLGEKVKAKVDHLKEKIIHHDDSTGIDGMDRSTIKREAKHQAGSKISLICS